MSNLPSNLPLDFGPEHYFGPVIYSYSRAQAIEDGAQVDVSETAREAGIVFPLFITRAVFERCVAVPPGVTCQDERGRLWDVVMMTRFAITSSKDDSTRLPVRLFVRNSDIRGAVKVELVAIAGPRDIDDPSPAITVMFPDEN